MLMPDKKTVLFMPKQNKGYVVDAGTTPAMLLMSEETKSHIIDMGRKHVNAGQKKLCCLCRNNTSHVVDVGRKQNQSIIYSSNHI